MTTNMTSKSIDIVSINSAIDNVKKVSLKDAIATMSTSKFYAAKNTDKRSLSVLSIVASLYNLAMNFDTFFDDDVDAAFKRAMLLNAKELFCIAQRMTNHLISDEVDSAKIDKLREEQAKLASKLAKYEAKQAKIDSKKQAKLAKIKAKKQAKLAKLNFAKMSRDELMKLSDEERDALNDSQLREYRVCLVMKSSNKSRNDATQYVDDLQNAKQLRDCMLSQMSEADRNAYADLDIDAKVEMLDKFIHESIVNAK
jgi:hypothetical protein